MTESFSNCGPTWLPEINNGARNRIRHCEVTHIGDTSLCSLNQLARASIILISGLDTSIGSSWPSSGIHNLPQVGLAAGHSCPGLANLALCESWVTAGQGNKIRNDNYLPGGKNICTTCILVRYLCQHSHLVFIKAKQGGQSTFSSFFVDDEETEAQGVRILYTRLYSKWH